MMFGNLHYMDFWCHAAIESLLHIKSFLIAAFGVRGSSFTFDPFIKSHGWGLYHAFCSTLVTLCGKWTLYAMSGEAVVEVLWI